MIENEERDESRIEAHDMLGKGEGPGVQGP
jgi:hypothetical protein